MLHKLKVNVPFAQPYEFYGKTRNALDLAFFNRLIHSAIYDHIIPHNCCKIIRSISGSMKFKIAHCNVSTRIVGQKIVK